VNFTLIKRIQLSGNKASVYTVRLDDGTDLFDQFLSEHHNDYGKDVKDILQRIRAMANRTEHKSISLKQRKENRATECVLCTTHPINTCAFTAFEWATP
jgi:hypothetical protein